LKQVEELLPPPVRLGNLRRMVEMMMKVMEQDELTNGYE
jgi:hypothetical protein